MFLVGLLSWWYGDGWRERMRRTGRQLAGVAEFFSIGQLLKTMFAPFRQISAGSVSGSVEVQLRAWFDRLISRVIGAFVRFFTIIAGVIILSAAVIAQGLLLAGWLLLPLALLAGIILTVIGWVPTWR